MKLIARIPRPCLLGLMASSALAITACEPYSAVSDGTTPRDDYSIKEPPLAVRRVWDPVKKTWGAPLAYDPQAGRKMTDFREDTGDRSWQRLSKDKAGAEASATEPDAATEPLPGVESIVSPDEEKIVLATMSAEEKQVLALLNAARVVAGLKPLRVHPALQAAAHKHAEDMSRQGYMAHAGKDGS